MKQYRYRGVAEERDPPLWDKPNYRPAKYRRTVSMSTEPKPEMTQLGFDIIRKMAELERRARRSPK